MADVEITFRLPAELVEKARERGLLTAQIYAEWLQDELEYGEDEDAYEDTPDEVILEHLREALTDALAGRNLRPAREVLDEIRRELEEENNDDD